MTIRDKLEDMRRKAGMAALIGGPMSAAGVVLSATVSKAFILLLIPSLILCGCFAAYMSLGMRYPRCRGSLGYALSYPASGLFGISKKIRFCQFCGVSLDSELAEQEGPTDQTT